MDKKINLFFMICIPLRILLVYIAYILPPNKLRYMGYLMLIPSIGFGNSFLKYKKGDRGAFGGNVWWNNYRLVHSINYLIFAIMTINMNPKSYLVLLFDVILGIGFFSNKYFF
jgi:hypothetical protein